MSNLPYDQRLARILVPRLARRGVTANQITTATLALALVGALLFAGEGQAPYWGAGLFVAARFLDHFDGELARFTGTSSRFGYYYDYAAGAASYAALFFCMGLGQAVHWGDWALVLGTVGAAAAVLSCFTNLGIDKTQGEDAAAVGYPMLGGFELEDGIYLVAPVTWLGLLPYFFLAAGIGAAMYFAWSFFAFLRARGARPA